MTIRIALADDHPIVTEGLSQLLKAQSHLDVIATYNSGEALLAGLDTAQPDVLLLDVHFPDTDGKALSRIISTTFPRVRILALSSVEHLPDIKEMLQNGCAGYLLKNVALPVLIEAIETVHAGGEFLEPGLKEQLFNALLFPAKTPKTSGPLTQREQKILELVAQGRTNREIAEELFLSYRTIQNNRLSLYQKFGVHNTAELIKEALQQGLVR